MKTILLVSLLASSSLSCSDVGVSSRERDFNVRLRYGILARNEINTFQNTYTKDLILDGTVTVPFVLSEEELRQIKDKMIEIGFFSYPDTFVVVSPGGVAGAHEPHPTYDFRVEHTYSVKILYWDDGILAVDPQATKLRELVALIRNIIESKLEFQRLPPARGGYL